MIFCDITSFRLGHSLNSKRPLELRVNISTATITLVANVGAVFGVVYFTCLEQPALIAYPTAALVGLGMLYANLVILTSLV